VQVILHNISVLLGEFTKGETENNFPTLILYGHDENIKSVRKMYLNILYLE